ncbi:MAG: adenylyltransferase, partial [Chloroflexi bacterium]|nr:adenylyltransferase [Chloroflexota bacterium]
RCVYRGDIPEEKTPVVGVTPAIIGCIQAAEVIKHIVGIGQLLTNKLLIYDGLTMKFTELKVKKNPDCEHCGQLVKDKK